MSRFGYRKLELKDLKMVDGFYWIGEIYDVDGNPWVEAKQAQEILDIVNKENLDKVVEEDELYRSFSIKHRIAKRYKIGPYAKNN